MRMLRPPRRLTFILSAHRRAAWFAAIALACWMPRPSLALVCPVNGGVTIDITSADTVAGTCVNDGTINVGTVSGVQTLLQNSGTLENNGSIVINQLLQNNGTIENHASGSMNIVYFGVDALNTSTGIINNAGTITTTNSGIRAKFYSDGAFTNLSTGSIIFGAGTNFLNRGTWTNNAGGIVQGNAGSDVANDGVMDNQGTVTLQGVNSRFLVGGQVDNAGTLSVNNLQNGGSIGNDGTMTIGNVSNEAMSRNSATGVIHNTGTLTLVGDSPTTGDGGLENLGQLFNDAGGSMVFDGEPVLDNGGLIQNAATATIDLTSGGQLLNRVGATLTNGGVINGGATTYLENRGSFSNSGTANLQGQGALWNYGTVTVAGTGEIAASAGAVVNNFGAVSIGATAQFVNDGSMFNGALDPGDGSVIPGGTVEIAGNLHGTGTYTQYDGTTIVNGTLEQSTINIEGGLLKGSGTITGTVNVGPGGSVQPGNSPGTLTIDGDFFLNGGTLVLQVYGAKPGEHDVLTVTGKSTFSAGDSIVLDFSGFSGESSDLFDSNGTLKPTLLDLGEIVDGNGQSSPQDLNLVSFLFTGLDGGTTPPPTQITMNVTVGGKTQSVTAAPVPLPGPVWLAASSMYGFIRIFRRSGARTG